MSLTTIGAIVEAAFEVEGTHRVVRRPDDEHADAAHRKAANGIPDGGCAEKRVGRAVEHREESVAGGGDLVPMVAQELFAHDGVMRAQHFAPAAVTELRRVLGRADDVGEEDGRDHPAGLQLASRLVWRKLNMSGAGKRG